MLPPYATRDAKSAERYEVAGPAGLLHSFPFTPASHSPIQNVCRTGDAMCVGGGGGGGGGGAGGGPRGVSCLASAP
jgi:hypothetical protein